VDVAAWLKNLGLGQYEAAFRDNAIDGDVLARLTSDDLKDLGVTIVGHRRKLLDAIAALNTSAPLQSPRAEPPPPQKSAEVAAERRPVAIMFCDLVGYMRLSSRLDPEEVHAILERFFAIVDAVVDSYGGTIDKHIGDAAMALFGAPRAYGDDGLRAVRAALEIQSAVPAQLASASGALAVHVGLAMGEVVASRVGSERRREYTVVGEAANLAARLLGQARAGETLVSEEIWRVTSRFADYETLGGQELKGFERPVPVFRLKGLREAAAGGLPIVGRRRELAQCRRALTAVAEGSSGAVIVVRGEPGIGKTRFVEELHSIASDLGFQRHIGWVLDFGAERGHGAVGAIVRSLLALRREASHVDVEQALTAATDPTEPANDDALYLRDLMEVPQRAEDRALYEAIDAGARARGRVASNARSLV
jgi:class 3 adenylate cyclase